MLAGEQRPVIGLSSNVLDPSDPAARPDGIGTYTGELEDALAAQGVVVRRVGAPRRAGARLVRPRDASISFPLPLPYLTGAASAFHVATPFARAVERQIDLYHATDYLVPRLARTPVVATLYDAIPLVHPEWANPRLRRLKNWLLRNCAQSADLVIAISGAAVDELTEHYRMPRARIRVVPPGVHARWFEPPDPQAMQASLVRHGLRRGYMLHVGTLQPRKNLDRLVSAYESLPVSIRNERQLVLVGKYGWGVDALRSRLERLRPQGRIVWVDYVERDELHALYCGAGMFVFPSLAEGFGLPLLEAFACGLPVVAGDLPALREVAGARAELIDARRTDAIADAMERIHRSTGDSAAVASRREYARSFSWSSCASGTLAVYRELLRA